MEGHLTDGVVEVGANGRERYYDSRGYGRPRGEGVGLAPVEAAHLLYRGDLDAVDGAGLGGFLGDNDGVVVPFLVYKDLRERGFYVSPARDGWVEGADGADFVVHPRGDGPWDGTVEHRVRVVGERASVALGSLGDVVLAVVDEESELTYLETDHPDVGGSNAAAEFSSVDGDLLGDRVICWDPPAALYERGFYGQPLDREGDAVQLSLLEAASLAERGALSVDGGADAIRARGRSAEGDRFDRRYTVYRTLREQGVVPKTGFKFGADFRTYDTVEHVDEIGHSELLVRVLPAGVERSPREIALDVRLAHGVRKRMIFALVGSGSVRWLSVGRLTP
ncbi:MAG: tRNA-intron endonuclease [Natronomonas sp.]|mgnify:FL=1|jgi:tRNA-intron endonuclease|uniref:tRNA-intron lyase n=1 Tax=Natronomonas sp. TaxID=2184060 RepID=UPI0039896CB7